MSTLERCLRVGLTYDLRADYLATGLGEEESAEFDAPETIDGLAGALASRGFEVERIGNVRALAARLVAGERFPLVFNICEGLRGRSREAQVPALLEAYDVPYVFSDPLTMALTLDKAMAKRVVRDHGIPTAPFLVLERGDERLPDDTEFPLFVKPLAEGTGKGIGSRSHVESPCQLREVATELVARHRQPVLVEQYLPGREFTVGIVGTGARARSLGVMEVLAGDRAERFGYGYLNKEHYEDRVTYRLADDAEAGSAQRTALAAWRALGCRDGGRVDLRSDERGVPCFLEVNPLAGLHPERSDLVILARLAGWGYPDLIGAIVEAALDRLGLTAPAGELRPAALPARG